MIADFVPAAVKNRLAVIVAAQRGARAKPIPRPGTVDDRHDIEMIAERMYLVLTSGNPWVLPLPFNQLDPPTADKYRMMARKAAEMIEAGM